MQSYDDILNCVRPVGWPNVSVVGPEISSLFFLQTIFLMDQYLIHKEFFFHIPGNILIWEPENFREVKFYSAQGNFDII